MSSRVVPALLVIKDTKEQLDCQEPGGSPASLASKVHQEHKATRGQLGPPDLPGIPEFPGQRVTLEAKDQLDSVEHL